MSRWIVRVFGDVTVDLRQTPAPEAVVAVTEYGNIEVLVPEGVAVDVRGFTALRRRRIAVPGAAGSRAVQVRAYTVWGNVRVRSPGPEEPWPDFRGAGG